MIRIRPSSIRRSSGKSTLFSQLGSESLESLMNEIKGSPVRGGKVADSIIRFATKAAESAQSAVESAEKAAKQAEKSATIALNAANRATKAADWISSNAEKE